MSDSLQSRVFSLAVTFSLVAVLMCQCQMSAFGAGTSSDHCEQHAAGEDGSSGTQDRDCCVMGASKPPALQTTIYAQVQVTIVAPTAPVAGAVSVCSPVADSFINGPPGNDRVLARTCALLI